MKNDIHPTYFKEAKVSCICGNHFTTGATVPEIKVEVCSNCHPFYTGRQKFIDTTGRLERFKQKLDAQQARSQKARPEAEPAETPGPETTETAS